MTGASRRKRAQAVLFSAIMVLSMVAVGVGGLAGSAAAQGEVTPAEGEVLLLNSSGTELGESPYDSIQAAIDAADESPDAERIVVGSGNYGEIVTVDVSGLTLEGVDKPVIRAPDDFSGPGGTPNIEVAESATDVTIRGFEVDTRGVGGSVPSGIILNGNGGKAINNTVSYSDEGANGQGFISGSGDGLLIKNNTIDDTVIAYGGDGSVEILNNTFKGPKITEALWSTSSGSLTIRNNNFTDADPGTTTIKLTNQDVTVNGETEANGQFSALADANDGVETVLLQGANFAGVTEEGVINDAVGVADTGYTVYVEQGTYDIEESIILDSENMELVGNDATINVTADGGYSESTTAIQVYADGTTISGFTFENFLPRDGANAISVSGADNNGVQGATITQNTFDATLDESDDQGESASTAVLAYQTTGEVNVTNNNFDVDGPSVYAVYGTSDTDVDATSNWWGSSTGPSSDAVTDNVEVNPWLDAPVGEGGEVAVAATVDGEEFSSIQSAVSTAKDGDTVIIQSGVHSENITVSTPNVTVDGQDSAVIDGRIDIPVDEVTVTNLTVQNGAPSGSSEVEGIFIGNAGGFDDLDGDVTLRNVVVEDVHGHGTGSTVEGVHVKYYDNGDEIDGITFDNLTVRNVTQTAAGADGVKLQAEVDDVSITNSTFSDIEGAWAYGVVSTPSSVEMGVPDDVTLRRNTIENVTATEYDGIGLGIDGKDKNGYADASDVRATQNDFLNNDLDIVNKEPDGGPMFAPLNYFGEDGPNVTGNVVYDPVLTTSEENVAADSPRNISEYGSVLELQSDGSRALAVGFSARPDESVGEIFGEMDISGNAFVYDNEAGEYQDISGDYVPSVGEVVVLTSEGGIDETVTVPIETNVDNEAATPESVSLSNGWNLVATGGTVGFDSSTLDIAGAEVQNDLQLQAQPSQPGLAEGEELPPSEVYTGAFEGTWIFVDDEPNSDAQLATGYAEDQSVEEYVFEVVYPNDPQAEYPPVPIDPRYPPEFAYPPELIYENPDAILAEENTDE
ncbi:surface glycoprotein [Halorubrum salinum]|uniref:surface glycoprotein n=1 Tax=Halorubrum salinum TaxID=767517 RepID=UPI002111A26A|nr:surface glycoprotein [Halorubrum salinum]